MHTLLWSGKALRLSRLSLSDAQGCLEEQGATEGFAQSQGRNYCFEQKVEEIFSLCWPVSSSKALAQAGNSLGPTISRHRDLHQPCLGPFPSTGLDKGNISDPC